MFGMRQDGDLIGDVKGCSVNFWTFSVDPAGVARIGAQRSDQYNLLPVASNVDATRIPHQGLWLWGLLIATLCGAAIRLVVAAERPVWGDERLTWRDATQSSVGDLLLWRHSNQHAPLSYVLVRASLEAFGQHERWALRLPALLAGIACIPAAFLLGRAIHSNATGFVASALVAVDLNMIDQSAQARMYTLLALITLFVLAWVVRLFRQRRHRIFEWCGLGAALAAAMWTSFGAVSVLAGLLLAAVVLLATDVVQRKSPRESAHRFIGVGIALSVVLVLCIPGLIKAAGMSPETSPDVTMQPSVVLDELYRYVKRLIDLKIFSYLILVLAVVGLIGLWKRAPTAAAIIIAVAMATLALQFPLRGMHRFLAARYLTTMQPAIWIGLAFLPSMIERRGLQRTVVVVLTCFVLVQGWRGLHMDSDWRKEPSRYAFAAAVEHLGTARRPGDALLLAPHRKIGLLTEFLRIPVDAELSGRLARAVRRSPPDVDAVLDKLDAEATWILARVDKPERGWVNDVRAVIEATAGRYGVAIDTERLDRQLTAPYVLLIRIDAEAVVYWSPTDVRGSAG
jgi:hypothetical protein